MVPSLQGTSSGIIVPLLSCVTNDDSFVAGAGTTNFKEATRAIADTRNR